MDKNNDEGPSDLKDDGPAIVLLTSFSAAPSPDVVTVAPEHGAPPNEVGNVDLVPFEEEKGGDVGSDEIETAVNALPDGIHSEHEVAHRFGADCKSQIVDSESFHCLHIEHSI